MKIKKFFDFSKKTAFVLGGSGLIGAEVSKKLSFYGCKVINLDIKKSEKNKNIFFKFDCTKKNVAKKYLSVVNKFGLPDIFINCSYPKSKDWNKNNFKEIKINSLKVNIENQITYSTYLIREVAELNKKKKKNCSIILLGSIYGLVGQDKSIYQGTKVSENLSYALAKGSIISVTKQMCSYYTRFGIRINNVCPGGVFDDTVNKNDKKYKKLVSNYSKRSAIGRMALPKEIADPIVFLASDDASYISGINLVVDGGWTSI